MIAVAIILYLAQRIHTVLVYPKLSIRYTLYGTMLLFIGAIQAPPAIAAGASAAIAAHALSERKFRKYLALWVTSLIAILVMSFFSGIPGILLAGATFEIVGTLFLYLFINHDDFVYMIKRTWWLYLLAPGFASLMYIAYNLSPWLLLTIAVLFSLLSRPIYIIEKDAIHGQWYTTKLINSISYKDAR